eukprot:3068251-Prymnesium_polylepis.1
MLSGFLNSTVVYTSTSGTQVHINQCTDQTFVDPDPTRTVVDVNLQNTQADEYLRTGPDVFRECVLNRAHMTDTLFTQAVIDRAASNLDVGYSYADAEVYELCRHHFNRCFMYYDADRLGDGSSPVVGGTATYNLSITYHGQVYDYPIHMAHCGQVGYHDYVRYSNPLIQRCFLNETVLAGEGFHDALQNAEYPHMPTIGMMGRYAWATSLVCNKQQHVCGAIPEYNSYLSEGCQQ